MGKTMPLRCLLIGAIAPSVGKNVSPGCLPFGVMALSSFLKENGVDCKVVSTALPLAADKIFEELDKADLFGISSMSGPYLSYAISIIETIRKIKPNLPIVWGGPHASLMGEDLINRNLADYVIKGVGEKSLLMLIKSLGQDSALSFIPGLIYRDRGQIKQNPPDLNFDINEFPQLDYSIILNLRPSLLSEEYSYFSSRGCPFDCSYCVASIIYNRRWYNKSEDKVVSELTEAYNKYRYKSVFFWDDNLFVDPKRLTNILSRLNEVNINFKWSGFCRADLFAKFDDEIIKEFKNYGLIWISIGAESGSQRILDSLNKGIKVEHIKEAVVKLKNWDIPCDLSFMGGLPTEQVDDFYKTLDLLKWVKNTHPQASVRLFRFIPYPKMPILNSFKNTLPTNTYDWCNVTYQNTQFFSLPKKINRALHILSTASLYAQKPQDLSFKNLPIVFLYYLAQFRIKTRFFYFPIEGIAVKKLYDLITLRILKDFKKELNKKKGYLN